MGSLAPTPAACFPTQPSWGTAPAGRTDVTCVPSSGLAVPAEVGCHLPGRRVHRFFVIPAWMCVGSRPPLSTPRSQRRPPRLLSKVEFRRAPPARQAAPRREQSQSCPGVESLSVAASVSKRHLCPGEKPFLSRPHRRRPSGPSPFQSLDLGGCRWHCPRKLSTGCPSRSVFWV